MKKTLSLILGAALCLGLLAACGSPASGPAPTQTPEPVLTGAELAAHYKEAIESARSDEDNEAFVIDTDPENVAWDMLGFEAADVEAFALSWSLINVHAYTVGLFKPVEGKADAVMEGLRAHIDRTVNSFTNYLPDQLEIAENAILEQLDDGTIVLVMCSGWDEVYNGITAAL